MVADRNDRKKKKRKEKDHKLKGRGGHNQIVDTVPAADQHCRLNMVDPMRDKYGHHHDTRERVDERLQYSYNARTPPSHNTTRHNYNKTPPLHWNSFQQQQHHYNLHHQEPQQHVPQVYQDKRSIISQEAESRHSRHSRHQSHSRKTTSDSMAEAWKIANNY